MSNQSDVERIKLVVKEIVNLLVHREFDKLDILTHGKEIQAKEALLWLDQDEQTLCQPPIQAFEDIEFVGDDDLQNWTTGEPFPNGWTEHNFALYTVWGKRAWKVAFDMWVEPGKRSDYTLELSVHEDNKGNLLPTIDNLHIL